MNRPAVLILLLFAPGLFGCAHPSSGVKGTLTPMVDVDREAVNRAYQPKRLALVVGINAFQHPEWRPLQYAVKDAEDVAGFLSDPSLGYFDEVEQLTVSGKTDRRTILEAMDRLRGRDANPDDTVLIYFSTHGTLARDGSGRIQQYIVASDTDLKDVPGTGIQLDVLKRLFTQFRSRRKVLILAFCYSGGGKSRLPSDIEDSLKGTKAAFFVKPLESVSEASVILSASAWGETANEDAQFKNDIYTHFLLEGMKDGDQNQDGAVTVSEAHDFAKDRTYYYTKGQQRPTAESEILGMDPIVLAGKPARPGLPILFDYSEQYGSAEVRIDGKKKGTLPTGIAVEPGEHTFAVAMNESARPFYQETIHLQEGDRLSIPFLIRGYEHDLKIVGGYQSFFNDRFRKEGVGPLPFLGLTYTQRDFFRKSYALALDVAYGTADQDILVAGEKHPAQVSEGMFGAALLYQSYHPNFLLQGGPRLGGIYLDRNFDGSVSEGRSSYLTVSPGVLIEALVTYRKRWSFSLGGSVNYANLRVDGNTEDLFYLNAMAALMARF